MIEIVFFILCIGPFLVKYLQYFYFLQLHDYSLLGIRKSFWERIFKKVFFHFWSLVEVPFFFLGIFLYFLERNLFEYIFMDLLFYYLMIYNVFVLGKLFRGRILKPRFDMQTVFSAIFLSIMMIVGYYFASTFSLWALYIWILAILTFPFFFIDAYFRIYFLFFKKQKYKNS